MLQKPELLVCLDNCWACNLLPDAMPSAARKGSSKPPDIHQRLVWASFQSMSTCRQANFRHPL